MRVQDIITPQMLVSVSKLWGTPLDEQAATEMVWFANFAEDDVRMDNAVRMVTASLTTTLFLNREDRAIPPRPRIREKSAYTSNEAVSCRSLGIQGGASRPTHSIR